MNLIKYFYRLLPKKFRLFLRRLLKTFLYRFRKYKLKLGIFYNDEVNLILGAALTSQKGWYSTNEEWLDISNSNHWNKLFKGKNVINHVVAEHVMEHLTVDEMDKAINLIHKHLRQNGNLRIAVPDGNNPHREYIKNVGINGIGADASDHKQLITYEFIKDFLEKRNFKCYLREGYLANGKLIHEVIDDDLGFIMRSRSKSYLYKKKDWDFIDSNTSLIIDAKKSN